MIRSDETWHRLSQWTYGQAPSERLAAQILIHENYESLDPSHPLGGRDGTKDAECSKEGKKWIMAVSFSRRKMPFTKIKCKFKKDAIGVKRNTADGLAFVTNQEITVGQRKELAELVDFPVDIFHLERITAILDTPSMNSVREKYLFISPASNDVVPPDIHVSFKAGLCYENQIHPAVRKIFILNKMLPKNHGYCVVSVCIENKGNKQGKNIRLKIVPDEFDINSSITYVKNKITGRSMASSTFLEFEFYNVNRGEIRKDAALFAVNFDNQDNINEVGIRERTRTTGIKYELTCDDMLPKSDVIKIT